MFKKIIIGWCITFSILPLQGQSVGLVLSGGGAKGLAHIGVIRALEENRIPIDYIAGTSMGAIIGSLYAMGMNTDEMIRIFKSEEFNLWLTGDTDEEHRYYFKTEYPGPDLFRVGLDVKDTIPKTRLPLSLIPNHLMDFAFMEIFSGASAAAGYDFDSLFIPFLCNSVDISNNREVVFRSGELAQAVRASMTVPLYFRPIVIDGNIMYDGGIYNNFPLNHMKNSFDPEVIIGSKAAEGNDPPDEFDIQGQIENIVVKPTVYHVDPDEGILLDMNFKDQPLLSFDHIDEYIEKGYLITMGKMDSIKLLVERIADDTATLNEKRAAFRNRWPALRFKNLELEGLNEEQAHYVRRNIWKSNGPMEIDQVKSEYLKLANDQGLFYLYPRALYDKEDSLFTLKLRVIPQAPLEARFGLFFATTGIAQTYLGFSYRSISEVSTHVKGNVQFGRFYNGAGLGIRFDYPSRIPLFFQAGFNYNGFDYNTFNTNFFFEDLKPSYLKEDEINFRFDAGVPYSINGMIKGGVGIGRNREVYYMKKDISSTDTADISNMNLISLYLAGEKNTLNNKQFATEGSYRKLAVRGGYGIESYMPGSTAADDIDRKENYFWFSVKYCSSGYIPLSPSLSLGYLYQAQATFKPLMNNYFSTIMEAPVFRPNLISNAFFMEQFRAHHFVAAGLMPVWKIRNQVHAKMEAYAFFPVQEIVQGPDNEAILGTYFNTLETIVNLSLNVITVAGPASLNIGYLSGEEKPWIAQLSFGYLLFNKRSTDD